MVSNHNTPLAVAFVCVCDVHPLVCSCMLHCLPLTAWSRMSPRAQQIHHHHNLQTLNLQSPVLYYVVCIGRHGRVVVVAPVVPACFVCSSVVVVFGAVKVLSLVVMVA